MQMKKLCSGVLAATLLTAVLTVSQSVVFAESVFADATSFLTDVIEVALTDVTATTKADAIAYMQSKISMSGDAVLYDGSTIGYWYSDASSTLYSDAARTDTLVATSGSGYAVDPTVLSLLAADVNSQIVETYTPTTSDWSKIIGKYDVTLGDITIPAEQWIDVTPTIVEGDVPNVGINFSQLTGIYSDTSLVNTTSSWPLNSLVFIGWLVDENGDLYISNGAAGLSRNGTQMNLYGEAVSGEMTRLVSYGTGTSSTAPIIKVGNYVTSINGEQNGLLTKIYRTDASGTYLGSWSIAGEEYRAKMLKCDGSGQVYAKSYTQAKRSGVLWFKSPCNSSTLFHTLHVNMYRGNSSSKQVSGSALLTRRLTKLSALTAADVLTINASGWYVNGTTNFDFYLGSQQMAAAGDTADIDAVAEIAPLCFNVVVPTTLPLYIAEDGTVSTATNATVENKSNAAVVMTDIVITGKGESGWTLVAADPSAVRDAKEFTFTTSLRRDTVLTRGEVLPFTYNAELSPMTAGADSLDLATVSVTVDWAD